MKLLNKILSLVLCISIFSAIVFQSGAASAGVSQGGIDPETARKTNEEILADALNDPSLSAEAKAQLIEKERLFQELLNHPAMYRADYNVIMTVTPIMQETNEWCSAAAAQMVLKHMNVTYGSQKAIMSTLGPAPTMTAFIKGINQLQTKNTYIYKKWASQDELNTICRVAKMGENPIVFTLKAKPEDVTDRHWPYTTNGHYTVLRGYFSGGDYSIADPFYFNHWFPREPGVLNGYHTRTYMDLKTVNDRQAKGHNYVAY